MDFSAEWFCPLLEKSLPLTPSLSLTLDALSAAFIAVKLFIIQQAEQSSQILT